MSIQVRDLCFSYGSREVLKGVTFTAERGQVLSVLGPNGAGKSTLFRCLLGMLPSRDSVVIDGTLAEHFSAAQLARKIAYIPQSHNPVFHYSVLDMVLMGTTAQLGTFESPGKTQKEKAEEALERLGIGHLKKRNYAAISGGERQMVLIARALAQQAKWLIMDEPTASLDFGNRICLMQTVRQLAQDGYGIIQSTHDPEQAYGYSDKILALRDGAVLAWGTPEETVCSQVISRLYGVETEVCSLHGDEVRVCVPKKEQ